MTDPTATVGPCPVCRDFTYATPGREDEEWAAFAMKHEMRHAREEAGRSKGR